MSEKGFHLPRMAIGIQLRHSLKVCRMEHLDSLTTKVRTRKGPLIPYRVVNGEQNDKLRKCTLHYEKGANAP